MHVGRKALSGNRSRQTGRHRCSGNLQDPFQHVAISRGIDAVASRKVLEKLYRCFRAYFGWPLGQSASTTLPGQRGMHFLHPAETRRSGAIGGLIRLHRLDIERRARAGDDHDRGRHAGTARGQLRRRRVLDDRMDKSLPFLAAASSSRCRPGAPVSTDCGPTVGDIFGDIFDRSPVYRGYPYLEVNSPLTAAVARSEPAARSESTGNLRIVMTRPPWQKGDHGPTAQTGWSVRRRDLMARMPIRP